MNHMLRSCGRLVSVVLIVAALASACAEGEGGGSSSGGGGGGERNESRPAGVSLEADAGTRSDDPSTNTNANLGTGATGFELAPDVRGVRPDAAAKQVLAAGITYEDGTVHRPNYVECTADEDSATPEGDGFTRFRCLVEAPDVAPYEVKLEVQEDSPATVEFDGFETGP